MRLVRAGPSAHCNRIVVALRFGPRAACLCLCRRETRRRLRERSGRMFRGSLAQDYPILQPRGQRAPRCRTLMALRFTSCTVPLISKLFASSSCVT